MPCLIPSSLDIVGVCKLQVDTYLSSCDCNKKQQGVLLTHYSDFAVYFQTLNLLSICTPLNHEANSIGNFV